MPPAAAVHAAGSDPVLERTLLAFTGENGFTVRQAMEGVQIFGATGSGKTTGSGAALARAFLAAGFGGLVLTAKPDEADRWRAYCREAGRLDDLLLFEPGSPLAFNFLEYERRRPGAGAGLTENIVRLFMTVLEVGGSGQNFGGGDAYWGNALRQLLRNAVDLVRLADQPLSLKAIDEIIASAPQSPHELRDEEACEAWKRDSLCFAYLASAQEKAGETQDFAITYSYWVKQFPYLADRTRSIIVSSFTSLADAFLRGPLYPLLCDRLTVIPEHTHTGKVLLLNLPVKEFGEVGRFAQTLLKYCWQRATEQRDVAQYPNPVFLWADEAHFFVTSHDAEFQSTARSARAATVYLTQNLSNYYAAVGGDPTGRAKVDSLLGNLQTKIFHANGDAVTNLWGAELISKTWQRRQTLSFQETTRAGMSSSDSLEFQLQPISFTRLAKGGPENDFAVDAVVFQAGRQWQGTDRNYLEHAFKQH